MKGPFSEAEPMSSSDWPPALQPTGADLGSLFSDIRKLAGTSEYPYSFLTDRFRDPDEFRAAGRKKILELLGYEPEPVDPRPELLERLDRGDHIREKLLFSTTPHFRVPAYVLIPR